MAYATVEDVQARITREMTEAEQSVCATLLDDAATMIDAFAPDAQESAKTWVSIRMVVRAIGDGDMSGVPIGASQGSMSGLGYSQSWTLQSGAAGELYFSRVEKKMLGIGNSIGSYSPIEELAPKVTTND